MNKPINTILLFIVMISTAHFMCMDAEIQLGKTGTPVQKASSITTEKQTRTISDTDKAACTEPDERCLCDNGIALGACTIGPRGALFCQCCQQVGDSCSCGDQSGTCNYIALACSCDQEELENVQDPDTESIDSGDGDDDDEKETPEETQHETGEIIIGG